MISLGPFKLKNLLGRGGASEVWQGEHHKSGNLVAIKIAHTPSADKASHPCSFFEEAKRMICLHHPSIIRLFDYGRLPPKINETSEGLFKENSPYLIMELAAIGLHHYVGQMDWQLVHHIQFAMLGALSYLHANDILHCDIKPSNLLLSNDLTHIKLTDFGISCQIDDLDKRYKRHTLLGTPSYMAPEQFNRNWRDYGPWTDLYAFGCTMVELLTGSPPFGHKKSLESLKKAHLFELPPPLPNHLQLPAEYFRWLERLLAKDPADRYQTAADAAWALAQLTDASEETTEKKISVEQRWKIFLEKQEGSLDLSHLPTLIETQPVHTFSTTSIPYTHETQSIQSYDGEERIIAQRYETKPDHFPLQTYANSQQPLPPFPERWPSFKMGLNEQGFEPLSSETLAKHYRAPLSGREAEREQLWKRFRHTYETKEIQILSIDGEKGIGKSRLAEWLLCSAHQTGIAITLRAHFSPTLSTYQSLRNMLTRYLCCNGLHGRALTYQISGRMSAVQLLPAHREDGPITRSVPIFPWEALTTWLDSDDRQDSEPNTAFEQLLLQLSLQHPVILWLDDIHHSKKMLDWCQTWPSHAPARPIFIIQTQTFLSSIPQSSRGQRITLSPLSQEEQRVFLAHWTQESEVINKIMKNSDGHPANMLRELQKYSVERNEQKKSDSGQNEILRSLPKIVF